jgi:hypothetical protein
MSGWSSASPNRGRPWGREVPPLVFHMAFARALQDRLHSRTLECETGAFLLGATTPDIRVLTRWDRHETHYFDFETYEHQDSPARFFASQPALAEAGNLSPATAAFVAGYTTHLSLDERWITEIYRTFFGERSSLGGGLEAQVLDRLLQYELDRRKREDRELMDGICAALEDAESSVECGFIPGETLRRWRELAAEQTTYPGDYERLRYYSGRQLKAWGVDPTEDEQFNRFVERVPELLHAALTHVTPERFDAFVEQSYEEAQRVIERYLGGA